MRLCHVGGDDPEHVLVRKVSRGDQVDEEALRHAVQGVARPGHELVHDRAADERRELAAADAEAVADGRVAEEEVKVLPHLVDEEREESLVVIGVAQSLRLVSDSAEDPIVLLPREQVRDGAARQHVVNVDQEALVADLAVRHQEGVLRPGLHRGLLVELAKVQLQRVHAVALIHQDGHHVVGVDEAREAGQGLLAGAAHANQQRIAAGVVGDARDAADVARGVVEEDEVHGRVLLVVLDQLVLDHLLQARHVLGGHVLPLVAASLGHEGREDERGREELVLGYHREVLRVGPVEDAVQLRLVGGVDQSVREDSLALVEPAPAELGRRLDQRAVGGQEPLEDVRDVLEVELVVELRRRGQEARGVEDAEDQGVDRRLHDRVAELLDRRGEGREVLLEDRRVDALDRRGAGREARDDREAPLEPRVHHEGARLGVHARGEADVHQVLFLVERGSVVHLPVRHHLREQHDGGLRVVGVHVRHVQVVDEEDALLVRRGAVGPAGSLVHGAHDDALKCEGGGKAVVVDRLVDVLVALGREVREEVLDDCRLAGSRDAHVQHRLLPVKVELQHVLHALQLHVADDDVLETAVRDRVVRREVLIPRHPVLELGLEAEVEAVARVRELDGLGQALHVRAEHFAVVDGLVVSDRSTDGPHHREGEHRVEDHLLVLGAHGPDGLRVLLRVVLQHRVDEAGEAVHESHVVDRARELKGLPDRLNVGLEVVHEHEVEHALRHPVHFLAPALHVGLPTDVGLVDKQDAAARHRRRAGVLHVLDLQNHAHRGGERNALIGDQRQHLVVVHDGVHRLDPRGVDVAVEDDPLVDVRGLVAIHLLAHVPEHDGDDAVLPLLRLGHRAVQLVGRHGLRVGLLPQAVLADLLPARKEGLPHLGLPAAGRANDEHAVAHAQDAEHANRLDDELRVRLQAARLRHHDADLLEVGVGERVRRDSGEQVLDQAQEDRHVQRRDLRRVEVAKSAAQDRVLVVLRLAALQAARLPEQRLHGAKTPVVVHLLREELTAEGVKLHELVCQGPRLDEALGHEHVLADEPEVRDDHRHGAEQRLEILRQLGAPGVARVHRDECSVCVDHPDLLLHKEELSQVGPDGVEDALVLRGHHREHLDGDAVELVEAAPGAGLGDAHEDLSHRRVRHLVAAVEDHDLEPQGAGEVLGGLRLAGARGAGRGAAQHQPQRLRQGDVAPVRQRGDHQTAAVPDVLVAVDSDPVADPDDARLLRVRRVGDQVLARRHGAPLEAKLGQPLEVRRVDDLLGHERLDDVAAVHVDGDDTDDFVADVLRQGRLHALDELIDAVVADLLVVLHGVLAAALDVFEGAGRLLGPLDLRGHEPELTAVVLEPLLARLLSLPDVGRVLGELELLAQHEAEVLLQLDEVELDGAVEDAVRGPIHNFGVLGDVTASDLPGVRRLGEVQGLDAVEDVAEVLGHLQRPIAVREDVEQRLVRAEVEAREGLLLLLEVLVERLLTSLDAIADVLQSILAALRAADLDDQRGVRGVHHQILPRVVHHLEALGVIRQLRTNIVALHEDRLKAAPIRLHFCPHRERPVDGAKLAAPLVDNGLAELDEAALRRHPHHFKRVSVQTLEHLANLSKQWALRAGHVERDRHLRPDGPDV
mmetsp:Transcript_33252/g.87955  ORF Transcript_33252/g.87955 Transcript_33252/m.87955 type:complete len:1619 (-) Transcript_33252:4415-9271(-)